MDIQKNTCAEHIHVVVISADTAFAVRLKRILIHAGYSAAVIKDPADTASEEHSKQVHEDHIYVIDLRAGDIAWMDILHRFGQKKLFIDCIFLLPVDDQSSLQQIKSQGAYVVFPREESMMPELPSVINQLACRKDAGKKLHAVQDGQINAEDKKQIITDKLSDIYAEITHDQKVGDSKTDLEQIIEERVKLLEYNTGEMISRHNADRQLMYISPACNKILGYSQQEMLGTSIFKYIHPEDAEKIRKGYHETIDIQKQNFNEICRVKRKDGRYIWLDVVNRILYKKDTGLVDEVVSIARDVTEHKEKEELLKAKEVAERANRAKSAFLANISHEIRNPLGAVMGMAKTLEKTKLDDEQKNYLRSIIISSGNLLTIVNDMLDYASLDSRKPDVVLHNFSLKEAFEELEAMFFAEAEERGNKLRLRINADVPDYIQGDKQKIQQVLSNLISNAIKFTSRGEVIVSVKKQNDFLLFSVKDSGIGVPKEVIPLLFDAFYQLDGSTHKEFQGVGLGLSIAKGLVEHLGGKLTFESEPCKGSLATFFLPFVQDAEQEASDFEGPDYQGKSRLLKVLVVEDDAINQMYIAGFLRQQGWDVDTAYNGLSAVELYQKQKYDIVIMDGQMPRMDGFEATRKIREIEQHKDERTPILAISGYAIPGDKERFLEAGMDDYLSKPIDERALLVMVKRLTQNNTNGSK